MGASSNVLAASSATQSVSAAGSAYAQSQAMKAQGEYQKTMMELNARMANLQAADAIKRGDKAAAANKKQTKQLIASQRVAMAAQGIEIDEGSALDIQEDTAAMGAEQALAIRNNAWREAWGFRADAVGYQGQGEMAKMAANRGARNTLVAGGMQALGYGMQSYGYYQQGKESGTQKQTPSSQPLAYNYRGGGRNQA